MTTLHDRPSLEQLKKQAKELLSAHKSGKPESCKVLKNLKKFSSLKDQEILETKIALNDAQYALALEHGFESWAKLKKFVDEQKLTAAGISNEIAEILNSIPSDENILSVDIGNRTLKIAEFARPVTGQCVLQSFAMQDYDLSVPGESTFKTISETLRQKRNEIGFKGSKCFLSLPASACFLRFKEFSEKDINENDLRTKIMQVAKEELSNTPIDDPVISWHLNSAADTLLTVAVRKTYLQQIIKAVKKAGLDPILILPSASAIHNSATVNDIGKKSCEIILNIGGSSSTMLFCEGANYFFRTMPIGMDTVTKRIAEKYEISFDDAEKLVDEKGSIGNNPKWETPPEPKDDSQVKEINTIATELMDKLCFEIKRSVSVWVKQQNGSLPVQINLAGGGSVMAGTPSFIKEKMDTAVTYFNPFRVVQLDKSVDRYILAEKAHLFSEIIGLYLYLAKDSPKSLNLKLT